MTNKLKITLPIDGMTCANCALRIEKTLNKTEGILNANVDLASEIASIEIDKSKINIDEIKNKIEHLGYKVNERPEDVSEKEFDLQQKSELKRQQFKFWLSLFLSIPIMILSMNWFYQPASSVGIISLNVLIFAFTTIVLFYSGSQFLIGFYKSLKIFYPDMNTLVSIGTLSAYFYSIVEFINYIQLPIHHAPHLYFDTTATIITFILLGKYLERKSKNSSSDAVKSLLKMQTREITVIRNNEELLVSVEFIKLGDIIILHPGESVPVDGIVIEGSAAIDESFVTGESIPVDKKTGDPITSGTECRSGALKLRAEKVGSDTYLSSIIELIRKAQMSKPPIQKYVDKVASIFVPTILVIAAITFVYWYFLDPSANLSTALVRFVSVLIVSCPCALGLATPTAIISAIGIAAKHNIYFRDVDSIEKVCKINTILLDKTGTLTTGKLEVTDIIVLDETDEQEILKLAASGEYFSEHPVGKAILSKNKQENDQLYNITNFESLTGYGIKFSVDDRTITLGNRDLLDKHITYNLKDKTDKLNVDGSLNVYVAEGNKILGIILLSDTLKVDAPSFIKKIGSMGIDTQILSGDSYIRTKKIAELLGVNIFNAGVKPEEKLEIISKLQAKGKTVAMVGDGINDAPALTKADISMAFLSGTDAAVNSSHITFTKNDLNSVYNSIIISNKTMKIIKQNLFWAFFYNLICIPIAAGIFVQYGVSINPSLAALAMAFSSVSVVSNSLRIKRMDLYDTK